MNLLATTVLLLAAAGMTYGWRWALAQRRTIARLDRAIAAPLPRAVEGRLRTVKETFPPRYRWGIPVAAATTALLLRFWIGLASDLAAALAVLVGVLTMLVEEAVADHRTTRMETQLSEAIDLLVSSLRAGSAVLAAFEVSLRDAQPPLRPYIEEVVARVRLGDDPREAILEFADRIPLDTVRLFAVSLAVHWEVGGSLAHTLASVGRTIRDRIELGRRVRAQAIEAHASVAAVLLIAYLLAFLMWRASPERMEAFLGSATGSALAAAVVLLQAVGLVWMTRISRSGA